MPASPPSRTPRPGWPPKWPASCAWTSPSGSPAGSSAVILKRRPDIERFLKGPPGDVRAALIYGRDRGVVRERADALAKVIAKIPDDPFDVALLTDSDID